ncbi:MAG TPA: hypothetical protein VK787_04275 [Puia sp.]|jgi:hypothetical protein|nr:hypothetical protein [Puia sp.]
MKIFWEGEKKSIISNGLSNPADITFLSINKWECVFYNIAIPKMTNAHMRAELNQDGTWIDLHISLTSPQPQKNARSIIENILKEIKVNEK